MPTNLKIFTTPEELAREVASEFLAELQKKFNAAKMMTIALSGGSTPALLFRELALYSRRPDWGWVKIFWSDERMVPPDHPQSNYGLAKRLLFDELPIPPQNIFRMPGEIPTEEAAKKYAALIKQEIPAGENGLPQFDWIFLGLGEDGHTASLFPGADSLLITDKICIAVSHPGSGQPRLTFTLPLINQAKRIIFLVTGASKSGVVATIWRQEADAQNYPAAAVQPLKGELCWYLDKAAASYLKK
jgi:6-phosphogluconolactonase